QLLPLPHEARVDLVADIDVERVERRLRLAIEQADKGNAGCDARLLAPLQTIADLAFEEIPGAVEQIDRDQAIGELANDLVAFGTARAQLLELVVEGERLQRRHALGVGAEIDIGEGIAQRLLKRGPLRVVGEVADRLVQRLEAAAIIAVLDLELAEVT